MSGRGGGARGGRGGGRGGRGGRNGAFGVLGDLPLDSELKIDSAPVPLFSHRDDVLPAESLTKLEREQILHFRTWRNRIHEGPYYAVLGESSRIHKPQHTSEHVNFDPFGGMPTYTVKYKKKRRTLPRLAGRNYVMEFFPEELLPCIDPKYVNKTKSGSSKQKVKAHDGQKDRSRRNQALLGEEDEEGDETTDEDNNEARDVDEELVENDYEEDEDEDNDYNAEQYFDNGEEDDFNDGGGDEEPVF